MVSLRNLGRSTFLTTLLLAALPGCGGDDKDTADAGPAPVKVAGDACEKGGATGDLEEKITVGGAERSYFVHIPVEAATKSVALVFAFHGDGGTGKNLRDGLGLEQHTKEEAIVVYPDANGGSFDIDTQDGNPDIAFFDAIKQKLQASHCITRVFATGFSRGAYFTNHLGCYRGDQLAAIASHNGGGPYAAPYKDGNLQCPSAPPSALVVNGLADQTVAKTESEKSIAQWTRTLGCKQTTKDTIPKPCATFDGCTKPMEWCPIPGLGHAVWDAGMEKTWRFFKAAP